MSWLRASFGSFMVCGLAVSAGAADDFSAQHEKVVSGNPAGVHLTITLRDGQKRFRIGERITVDYAFTADLPGKYVAGGTAQDQSGRSTLEQFVVDRPGDAVDPLGGFFDLYNALYCAPVQASVSPAKPLGPSTPVEDSMSVTQYLRFKKTGYYRLYAVTQQVIPADAKRASGQRSGLRPSVDDSSLFRYNPEWRGPVLASENTVEFEVLPQDHAMAREEVEQIIARTKRNPDTTLSAADAIRLFEIDTPQARRAAIHLYASDLENYPNQRITYGALAAALAAPTRAEAIRLLQQRFLDPATPPDYELFFDLPVLQLLEKNPDLTADDVHKGGRVHGDHWRNLMVANILAEYQALMAGLDQRSASGRALTVRFLHMNFSGSHHKACTVPISIPAEDLARLRVMHLDTLPDLPTHEQGNDLQSLHWWTDDLPRDELVPRLVKLFDKLASDADWGRIGILLGIGKFDPELSGKLFRRRVVEHDWTPDLSNFIPQLWYRSFGGPELDEYFGKVFATAHTEEMERTAPLLARFGTAAILPQIKQVYEVEEAKWPCSLQAGLLTYFLRVDPAYGVAQTRTALAKSYVEKQLQCRDESLLASIAFLYKADELENLAESALDDPRPLVAAGAARTLNIMFPGELPYQHLVERLRKLHDEWPDYASHANDSAYTSRWKSGYDRLEDILVRLLTNNSPTPKSTPLWKAVLDACVTEECRVRVSGRLREASPVRLQFDH
jgi:hypothetical protein